MSIFFSSVVDTETVEAIYLLSYQSDSFLFYSADSCMFSNQVNNLSTMKESFDAFMNL